MAIEETTTKTIKCRYCDSEAIVRFGQYKNVPRYWCKSCGRKFKNDSASFHGKVPSAYVTRALAEFYTGSSINDIRDGLWQDYKYRPSQSIVWKWIIKYTDLAAKTFKDTKPEVGSVWQSDETMVDLDKKLKVWVYNVIDQKTKYLLASRIALSRTTNDAEAVMREARKVAGKSPKQVLTDANRSYEDGIELTFGSETEHVLTHPFKAGDSTQIVERYHGTYKDRVKVMRAFRDVETLIEFNDGWMAYYNNFKPHQSLNGQTPAEAAGVKYDVKNWADLARVPISKESEIKTHKNPKFKVAKPKVNLERAFKRHRKPRITPPVPPISPKVGKLA